MSIITSTPGQLQVIKRNGEISSFDAEKIAVAIGKAFSAIDGSVGHIRAVQRRIHIALQQLRSLDQTINRFSIDQVIQHQINKQMLGLYNIKGALKLTATSNALSIFKNLKQITASIIFLTTRNFSIQKDLSISA